MFTDAHTPECSSLWVVDRLYILCVDTDCISSDSQIVYQIAGHNLIKFALRFAALFQHPLLLLKFVQLFTFEFLFLDQKREGMPNKM